MSSTTEVIAVEAGQVWEHRLLPQFSRLRITRPGYFEWIGRAGGEVRIANESVLHKRYRLIPGGDG